MRRLRVLDVLAVAAMAALAMRAITQGPPQAVGTPVSPIAWADLSGKRYSLEEVAKHPAAVFFFVSSQCPISNLYTVRMTEIERDYRAKGVACFVVDSNAEDTPSLLRRYARERSIAFPVVKDSGTALADALAASRTPEAIILDSAALVRYRGRIDDNQDRTKVSRSDVREALDDILAGRPVRKPRTTSFGCAIFRDHGKSSTTQRPGFPSRGTASSEKGDLTTRLTFSKDVAPILNRHCVACHRPGDVAPFALQTYQQAKTWSAQIKDYTGRKLMPPWKAVAGYGDFQDAHHMSDAEIQTIAAWVDAGAPEGNTRDLPARPKLLPPDEWALGKPDMVVMASRPYHLAAEGPDVYRNFVLPVEFKEDTYLSGIEFKPDNRAVVHHISANLDPTGKSAEMDGKETEPGYSVPSGVGIGVQEWSVLDGWAPGNTSSLLPAGTALRIPAGSRLVLQVHYHRDGKPEVDQTKLGLHFARGRVEKSRKMLGVDNRTFVLKPGADGQKLAGTFNVFADCHAWMIIPHMHLLGREMKVTATLPDGTRKPMVWVNDWDFNWQESYRYKEPLTLPKGTKVEMEATFDNSERNPRQPTHPPKEVRYGVQTTDEMCICLFFVTMDAENLNIEKPTGAAVVSRSGIDRK